MAPPERSCPTCGAMLSDDFYRLEGVPVHSVLLLRDLSEALAFPRGRIRLAHCPSCDFITNRTFDPSTQRYGEGYEGTQSSSETFNAFHRELASKLVERHRLHGKEIVEIGSGQGEFLTLLCEIGGNRGLGFDPAYDPSRRDPAADKRTRFVADFYSEEHSLRDADLVVCKMTLEHIARPAEFLRVVRRGVSARTECTFVFMVPDAGRILDEAAFQDIYYEHCSYFTGTSLANLFRTTGFALNAVEKVFGDQYLLVEAVPSDRRTEMAAASATAGIERFQRLLPAQLSVWNMILDRNRKEGRRAVIWGGGSKAVAFVTALGLDAEAVAVVDINPRKEGTFLPGSGHRVVGPGALQELDPGLVAVMNPVYLEEIRAELNSLGLTPEIVPVNAFARGPAAGEDLV